MTFRIQIERHLIAAVQKALPVVLLVLLSVSCATGRSQERMRIELAGLNAKTIAIVPVNLVIALPTELETSAPMVDRALREVIESHGKSVRAIGYRRGRTLWTESMLEAEKTGAPRSFESAARIMASELHKDIEFDSLIIASMYLQYPKWQGRVARWDGARQTVKSSGLGRVSRYCVGMPGLKGVSLLIHVLDANGGTIHSTQAGLELLHYINAEPTVDENRGRLGCRIEKNEPALQDEQRVLSGIARGLAPFLPEVPPEPTKEGNE